MNRNPNRLNLIRFLFPNPQPDMNTARFFLFLFGTLLTLPLKTPAQSAPYFGVTAHRGSSGSFPENTIPAYRNAIALKVDWAELDIFRTKDGKLVVTHDARTGRVADKDLEIAASTYDELKQLDVATGFRKKTGRSLKECPPQQMPLLEDILALFVQQSATKISIQPKADCVPEAIGIVRKMNAQHIVGFNDGNLRYMSQVKELEPGIPVFWDRPANSDLDEDIRIAREKKFETLVVNSKGLTAEKIQKIKKAGFSAGAWTVNDPVEMKQLLAAGIDRIYTDEPAALIFLRYHTGGIACEGAYKGHLQGICLDDENNIYWSWTDAIVRTDATGKITAKIAAPSHQGDLCYREGKIYVAVNLGKFNEPAGKADSWVYAFDARTLELIRKYPVPELVHGAGGVAYRNERFIVVGGLPPGSSENYLYEYDTDFNFQKRHVLQSGYTLMGIQTIAYAGGNWWLGCYGNPRELLRTDDNFNFTGKYTFDASLGIAPASEGLFLIGSNIRDDKGHSGKATPAFTSLEKGLMFDNQ